LTFLAACAGGVPLLRGAESHAAEGIVVGSKNFAESRLLAEMFARIIEAHTTLSVERRLGLAGTQVCFEALRRGAIDLYPEYTGTGLVTVLGEDPQGDARWTWNRVRNEFRARWNLWWVAPLGFENAYELAVPRTLSQRHALRTISDLVPVAPQLTAGLGYEFVQRDDGLPGLERVYGLRFGSVRSMQQALKYQAAGERAIDCLDVYTTDGRLVVHDLVVLEDDLGFFPPYAAAALVRGDALREHPEIGNALGLLTGALSEDAMRRLNLRVEHEGEPIERVAQEALESMGLSEHREVQAVSSRGRGLASYMWATRAAIGRRTLEHMYLSGAGVLLGILVAVPLGLALERRRGGAETFIRVVGTSQTIPSLALLAFMIPFFGIGELPAVVALWIYSVFPILRNTYTGLRDAGPDAVEAATALGMTPAQVLRSIRLPLAAPVIMAGIRTAAVITVGTATLAAFVGAGGLGAPIVSGVQSVDTTVTLSGALPAAALAIAVDGALGVVERRLRPRGLSAN
jgi:osmoprotectant transport system permease protein